ncbi:MAG: polyhydroxyalkanoate synthesis regulator DNA-binding domain-containing protein [Polyangiaceae bacterium]|nr:polyhydroxyalkanoate synthesis regulator DNA-binding domain-containing protein [Polyangiaceae bacterium]
MDGTVNGVEGAATRLIKRYANRKLYDTQESRYVTLQHIADFVRSGEEVLIIDNKSKDDVTSVTLAQIIYEEEKSLEGDRRSVRSLRDFIQDGRNRLLHTIFDSPVGKLVPRGESSAEAAPELSAADATRDALKSLVNAPKEAFDELQRLADDGVRALLGGALSHVQQLQGEVRRLQGRIDELETRLGTLAKRAVRVDPEAERRVDQEVDDELGDPDSPFDA